MDIALANIRDNPDMAAKLVRADVREIRAHGPEVVFWQEIGEKEDHDAIDQEMGKRFQQFHKDLAIPISLKRSHLRIVDTGQKMFHEGKAGASPRRYMAWAVVEHAERHALDPFILCNHHMVSGAWNPKPKPHKEWRQEMWLESWHIEQDQILQWHKQGYTVIWGGDWNRAHVNKYHPKQRWLIDGGIDKLAVLESPRSNLRVRFVEQSRYDINSDHDARFARIQLRRAA